MYRYDEFDEQMVRDRVAQFKGQVARRLSGELDEDHFKPLRLQNGVYLQLHAYMLRIAIPYGQLSSKQMRTLADVGEKYDKGYGHFTTRQNIQFNWIALKDIPTVLEELANVEMHAIQTSGNCIRNVTTDQFAGATAEEIEDPRPWCEIIRQWSTFHPEFAHLPRKFKIAVTAAENDRAAIRVHDIGLHMKRNGAGEVGFEIIVGGGLGRTPVIGTTVKDWVAKDDILDWLEAIMRVYNLHGRRDNKYKARIKILVTELTPEVFTQQVDAEFAAQRDEEKVRLPQEEVDRISDYFKAPAFETLPADSKAFEEAKANDAAFAKWAETNLSAHKVDGYTSVTISLKPLNVAPGDATSAQMRVVADIAKAYSFDDLRITHIQNIVLPHVKLDEVYNVYLALDDAGLGADNVDLASDLICCPGLDYCNLANARSIPVAMEIQNMFSKYDRELGKLHINISGCINACGHHHVGHIGILGVDKKGEEFYQITFGGRADEKARIGDIQGPGLRYEEVTPALERVAKKYLEIREASDEKFISTLERLGAEPFKEALYADS
ncbi:nitrite/sulfite reductase [Hirschia baltica]|uniref:Sulfite reductase (Ferredoxin) n=1 Tax=Hirschia baltica (strain ATCC 49814 / DSM 5838 / IFAM 1418) TaxID=582402 RepID=C6XN36_HIRBI|nr:nitrite/sulfite reductase [Hirschia baltica]ACT58206.1 Sulfite reductase (ferredoxin) [Hirschia baltica ATCC 49814]